MSEWLDEWMNGCPSRTVVLNSSQNDPRSFSKNTNAGVSSPEILIHLIWGGAWAGGCFKAAPGDSNGQPMLRTLIWKDLGVLCSGFCWLVGVYLFLGSECNLLFLPDTPQRRNVMLAHYTMSERQCQDCKSEISYLKYCRGPAPVDPGKLEEWTA